MVVEGDHEKSKDRGVIKDSMKPRKNQRYKKKRRY